MNGIDSAASRVRNIREFRLGILCFPRGDRRSIAFPCLSPGQRFERKVQLAGDAGVTLVCSGYEYRSLRVAVNRLSAKS